MPVQESRDFVLSQNLHRTRVDLLSLYKLVSSQSIYDVVRGQLDNFEQWGRSRENQNPFILQNTIDVSQGRIRVDDMLQHFR